ncbi:MAG: epimerase [Saprospiraceae bacterium]
MGKKVILTGSTGMVGKGVLLECIESPDIDKILVINRSALGISSDKIEELLLENFTKIVHFKDVLQNFDACFYCMGVTSIGLTEEAYSRITFDPLKSFVDTLYELNPNMTFIYVSGSGTDSTENGKSMWARVKGKTENYMINKGFKNSYAFRPGIILPEKGIKSKTGWYNTIYAIFKPFYPLLSKSKNVTSTTKIGKAMIRTLMKEYDKNHLENSDINILAE